MNFKVESQHAIKTFEYLVEKLRIADMLALTNGHADPGAQALEMILPLLYESPRINWRALDGTVPGKVAKLSVHAHKGWHDLVRWDVASIQNIIEAAAHVANMAIGDASRILQILVFGYVPEFSYQEAMVVLGQERTVSRLKASSEAYRLIMMVT
jgi:hypothetical protein